MKKIHYQFLTLCFIGYFILLWLKLFKIQVIDHNKYLGLAESQHERSLQIPARRGRILSADGFTLVGNGTSYLLVARPKEISNEKEAARKLTEILFEEESYTESEKKLGLGNLKLKLAGEIEEKLLKKNLFWVPIFHKITDPAKEKIEKLDLAGLGFEEEPERYYPESRLASFVLGFVGSNSLGVDTGYYGLEGYYNGDLKGQPGEIFEEQSASGHPIVFGEFKRVPSQDGRDLYLTLNRSVQFIAEEGISQGVLKYGAKSGTVIIMEPSSGAILAMASYPSFDPTLWVKMSRQMKQGDKETNQENLFEPIIQSFQNPAISETYEPGSVLKALTMSAGIATGAVTPQTTFTDDGPIRISGYTVDNWDRKHHGLQTMTQVLEKSNNMGAAFVARKIGAEVLREYFLKFGLGKKLGIDLEGEDTGLVKKISDFREIDLVTNSFGQGVSVTPLQLVSVFNSIANGGTLYKPFIVQKLVDGERVIDFKNQPIRRVLTEAKSRVMIEMLTAAAEGGEAKFFVLKKYRVAGKTGTAQIPLAGGYDPNKTNATFVGFLPGSLKFVMLVKLKEPTTSIYAAETAVPLWMNITKELVTYMGIPPDR